MSWVKLFKTVIDGCLGYQTINQMADNQADLRTQMFVEHGSRELLTRGTATGGPNPPPDWSKLGRHNLIDIPRTVAQTYLFLLNASTLPSIGSGMLWNGPGCPSLWRIDVGQYLIPVVGLSTFWATGAVALVGTSVTALRPQIRPFYASASNNQNNGLWVSTYKLDSGDFIPDDQAFSFALHGSP